MRFLRRESLRLSRRKGGIVVPRGLSETREMVGNVDAWDENIVPVVVVRIQGRKEVRVREFKRAKRQRWPQRRWRWNDVGSVTQGSPLRVQPWAESLNAFGVTNPTPLPDGRGTDFRPLAGARGSESFGVSAWSIQTLAGFVRCEEMQFRWGEADHDCCSNRIWRLGESLFPARPPPPCSPPLEGGRLRIDALLAAKLAIGCNFGDYFSSMLQGDSHHCGIAQGFDVADYTWVPMGGTGWRGFA